MQSKPPVIYFTPKGLEAIKKRHDTLISKRPQILKALQTAREMGDLSENGAYKAARFELSDCDRNLKRYRFLLFCAQVVTPKSNATVSFGTTVTLKYEAKTITFTLVGSEEADPRAGKISLDSPLGRALIGKKVGQTAVVTTDLGTNQYLIQKIVIL